MGRKESDPTGQLTENTRGTMTEARIHSRTGRARVDGAASSPLCRVKYSNLEIVQNCQCVVK